MINYSISYYNINVNIEDIFTTHDYINLRLLPNPLITLQILYTLDEFELILPEIARAAIPRS